MKEKIVNLPDLLQVYDFISNLKDIRDDEDPYFRLKHSWKDEDKIKPLQFLLDDNTKTNITLRQQFEWSGYNMNKIINIERIIISKFLQDFDFSKIKGILSDNEYKKILQIDESIIFFYQSLKNDDDYQRKFDNIIKFIAIVKNHNVSFHKKKKAKLRGPFEIKRKYFDMGMGFPYSVVENFLTKGEDNWTNYVYMVRQWLLYDMSISNIYKNGLSNSIQWKAKPNDIYDLQLGATLLNKQQIPYFSSYKFEQLTRITGFLFSDTDFYHDLRLVNFIEGSLYFSKNGTSQELMVNINKTSLYNYPTYKFEKEFIKENLEDLYIFLDTKAVNNNYYISIAYLLIKYNLNSENLKVFFKNLLSEKIKQIEKKLKEIDKDNRKKIERRFSTKSTDDNIITQYITAFIDELALLTFELFRNNVLLYYFDDDYTKFKYNTLLDFINSSEKYKINQNNRELEYGRPLTTDYRFNNKNGKVNIIYSNNYIELLFLKIEYQKQLNFEKLQYIKKNSIFLRKLDDFRKLGVKSNEETYTFGIDNEFILESDTRIILTSINGFSGFKFINKNRNGTFYIITVDNVIYYFGEEKNSIKKTFSINDNIEIVFDVDKPTEKVYQGKIKIINNNTEVRQITYDDGGDHPLIKVTHVDSKENTYNDDDNQPLIKVIYEDGDEKLYKIKYLIDRIIKTRQWKKEKSLTTIPQYVKINGIEYNFCKPDKPDIPPNVRIWGNINNNILYSNKKSNKINLAILEKDGNYYIYIKFSQKIMEKPVFGSSKDINIPEPENDIIELVALVKNGILIISDEIKLFFIMRFYSIIGNYECVKILFNILLSVSMNNQFIYTELIEFVKENNTPDTCYYTGTFFISY